MKHENPQAPQAPRSGAAAEGPIDVTPSHPVAEGRQSPGPLHEITFAVSRQGSAVLISAPKEIADGMDGDHLEDNCFKGVPKEPGTYIAEVEFVFHQGYFEGYPAAGESDWEYIIHSFRPLAAPGTPQGGGALRAIEEKTREYGLRMKGQAQIDTAYPRIWMAEINSLALDALAATPSQEEGPVGVDLEALEILERIQWNGALVGNNCPSCGGHSAYGHTEKCKLAKLIARLRSTQAPKGGAA